MKRSKFINNRQKLIYCFLARRTTLPFLFLFLVFIGIYAELSVIINVGESIGAFGVLILLFLTAAIGLLLVRHQGLGVFQKMNQTMARGEMPVREVSHGFLLLFSGILLIIPGFITDGLGALLLISAIRNVIVSRGMLRQAHGFYTWGKQEGVVLEGEYEKKDQPEEKPKSLENDSKTPK